MEDLEHNILDDRHECFNPYSSQCCKCKYFIRDGYACKEHPNGIPLDIPTGVIHCDEQVVDKEERNPKIE